MYLLDSNIIIYFLQNQESVLRFFQKKRIKKAAISTVSRLEVMLGAAKENRSLEDLETHLDKFINISLDKNITKEAALLKLKEKKSLKFKDLAIAATARTHDLTLVTADKDFKTVKGIKIELIKL